MEWHKALPYQKDAEKRALAAERSRQWRLDNPERSRASVKAYNEANPERHYNNWLQKQYGITREQYDALLGSQGFRCAICSTDQCSSGKRFSVDHCHSTGIVRGLLCTNCNLGIGNFKDNTEILMKAISYLSERNGDVY